MTLESKLQRVANKNPQNLLHAFFIKPDFPWQRAVNVNNYFNLFCPRLHLKYLYGAFHRQPQVIKSKL